jgi:hypothetical protein
VQIHEVGEAAGRPYFALEFMDGGSLAQNAAGTPQPPLQAAALVETLARPQDYGLWLGPPPGGRSRPHPERRHCGHAQLHGAGAGRGPGAPGRPGGGYLCAGSDPLRAADRTAAVSRRVGAGHGLR